MTDQPPTGATPGNQPIAQWELAEHHRMAEQVGTGHKPWKGLIIAVTILGGLVGCAGSDPVDTKEQAATPRPTVTVTAPPKPAPTVTVTKKAEPVPEVTVTEQAPEPEAEEPAPVEEPDTSSLTAEQENAISTAEEYLSYEAFSKKGLIKQLKFEGYSKSDATLAVQGLDVDYSEQAAKAAKDYLEYESFSHKGLVEQLEFEGYTPAQAEYGVSATGL